MSKKSDIGIIGLGVMGQNLARNFARQGLRVVLFNPPIEGEETVLETFIGDYEGDFVGTRDLNVFVELLDRPRMVHFMIPSGKPVDTYIEQLEPILEEGDIIIDGGNSNYKDTAERINRLSKKNIHFIGMGISGGKEGALKGPALMPGGSEEAKSWIMDLYTPIAAVSDRPCIHWMGPAGSGHFAKMVHNGIQYAEMQILAEAYSFLEALSISKEQIATIFGEWNQTIIGGYLMEISSGILNKKEEGNYLIDLIADRVSQKGTGIWTVEAALELGVAIPSIQTAVEIRHLSLNSNKRHIINSLYNSSKSIKSSKKRKEIEELKQAVLAARILCFSQAVDLIKTANEKYRWEIPIPELIHSWKAGCIIRSNILESIEASVASVETGEFLGNNPVRRLLKESVDSLSKTLSAGMRSGIPLPVLSTSFQYFSVLSSKNLKLSLVQAQRDYFGAHGYEKTGSDAGQLFFTDWTDK